MRRGHAEQRDDRVADELLDVTAMALEGDGHRAEVAVHHLPYGLGVELLAELRRPGHVREEHRHDPSGGGLLVLAVRRGGAGGAEPGLRGQRLAAPRARRVHRERMVVAAARCQEQPVATAGPGCARNDATAARILGLALAPCRRSHPCTMPGTSTARASPT